MDFRGGIKSPLIFTLKMTEKRAKMGALQKLLQYSRQNVTITYCNTIVTFIVTLYKILCFNRLYTTCYNVTIKVTNKVMKLIRHI